jgi:hypothetical protein
MRAYGHDGVLMHPRMHFQRSLERGRTNAWFRSAYSGRIPGRLIPFSPHSDTFFIWTVRNQVNTVWLSIARLSRERSRENGAAYRFHRRTDVPLSVSLVQFCIHENVFWREHGEKETRKRGSASARRHVALRVQARAILTRFLKLRNFVT